MSEYKYEDLRRLFDLALAAPAEKRSGLLDRECRGDSGLRKRIEAMIAASEDQEFLSTPTSDMLPPHAGESVTLDAPPAGTSSETSAALREGPGTRIGPYKLLQLIGEGGFGSVFMAQQEQPVQRRVALKIIKLGMDTRQVVARFEQERQALAMMDHPNIARVLDAGTTDTGRPYFVMELVKGDPIVAYCDKHNLSIQSRLELFAQVCQAVQHAHTKGIIHRDIKPSNILVTTQDDRPHAKVIDFGIAKATASKLTEKTLFTEHRQLIGTPEYMSPEQAEGSMDIDTRTDVYSLGVLLYELLTGSTPFAGKELRSAAYAEIQRIIREVDPPKPSTRLSQNSDTLAGVAVHRRTEPRKLGGIIRGDLDWIVMKALEKDRSRRYETANGLGMDIQRYLAGEAVVAAPPGTAYRFKKFVRRNKGAVAAGAAVTAALLIGLVAFAWQANRATRAEGVAKSRLAESEATVKFLDDMLGSADPLAKGKDVTVRSVLDEAAKSMAEKFTDRPLVAARLHGTIGRTYMGLGIYPVADTHVRAALAIRRRELGPDHEDTCRAVNELGAFLTKNGGHAEAETLLKQAIVDHERLFGRRHQITLQSIDFLATLYASQQRTQEAATLVKEVLDARTVDPGKEHEETLGSMNTLALLYSDMGRFDESEKLFESARAIQERRGGSDHPLTLDIQSNIAWMHYWAAMDENSTDPNEKKRRLERSRALGEQVLQARLRVLGEEHQETLTSMNNLSTVYRALGMHEKAEELQKKDVEICVRVLGEEHPDTIIAIANLGNSLRNRRRFEESLPYLERAVRNSRKSLPPDNPGTAFAVGWYGSSLRELGRFTEAEPLLHEARDIILKTHGEDHGITKQMALGLALLYEAWEKSEPGNGHGAKAAEWRAKSPKE